MARIDSRDIRPAPVRPGAMFEGEFAARGDGAGPGDRDLAVDTAGHVGGGDAVDGVGGRGAVGVLPDAGAVALGDAVDV